MSLKNLIIVILFVASGASHAQSPLFRIDSCGIYYKGDTLRHGERIENWIKVLGEPSRRAPREGPSSRQFCQWDELGVAIMSGIPYMDTDYNGSILEETEASSVFFFFQTINQDPTMKNRWKELWISDFKPNDRKKLENGKKTWQDFGLSAYSDSMRNPIHFFEPLYPLQKVILDGIEIHKRSRIEKLNPIRMKLGLEPIRFFGDIKGKYLTEHDRISKTYPDKMGVRVEAACSYWGQAIRLYFDKTKKLVCIEIKYSQKIMSKGD